MSNCRNCNGKTARSFYLYCSNRCQTDYQYEQYILKWQQGEHDGGRGINAKNLSGHVKRYLLNKYGEACTLCGWNKKHPIIGHVPLEIDHIDGDADNNQESNLRVICPNCHALTANYKNLNKGKGRAWRKLKYIKVENILPP